MKKATRRPATPKPRNGGVWTEARFRQFVRSLLRSGTRRWGPRHAAIRAAFVRKGINPATGRACKLHRCAICLDLFPQTAMSADHILPVVPLSGFDSWDGFIFRLFCEASGFQALCEPCHKAKTAQEAVARKVARLSGAPPSPPRRRARPRGRNPRQK